MSIYSNEDIKCALLSGEVIVEPLDEDLQIQSCSVDLRVGSKFLRVVPNGFHNRKNALYTNKPQKTVEHWPPYYIPPQTFILGTTIERVKIPNHLTARVEGRSSKGRIGLEVHCTAGYVDSGFDGKITLEFFNKLDFPIILHPMERVCQLVLETNRSESTKPYEGKYQGQDDTTGSLCHLDEELLSKG